MRMAPLIHCLGIFSVLIITAHGAPTLKPLISNTERFSVAILEKDFSRVTHTLKSGLESRITNTIVKMFHLPSKGSMDDIYYSNDFERGKEEVPNEFIKPMFRFALRDRKPLDREGPLCKDYTCYGWTERTNPDGRFGPIFSRLSVDTDSDGHLTSTWRRHRLDPSESPAIRKKGDKLNAKFEATFKEFGRKNGITVIIEGSDNEVNGKLANIQGYFSC
ncbi:hypothetical protein BDP27DRAFT_1337066 [Rhodocollybia butyracea]|uniref:Uncharacterized protein n=1 Tax=Rhodocollybia butyracea TaxID=206335 RepID=A0A9P5U018_9AGAR|nr:hypothetical protein BDP27DRAFT_1337066 [Rhodocollybia butyracea]